MTRAPDEAARELSRDAAGTGSPTAWFDELYREADAGRAVVPWDRGSASPLLLEWLGERRLDGLRSVVPGVGTGWDAELLAERGAQVVAFDVSEHAVLASERRHAPTEVAYVVSDLLALSPGWSRAFDLVVEAMTVQSMPRRVRSDATAAVRALVAPGGTLLVIGIRHPEGADLEQGPPWLLTGPELDAFADEGLSVVSVLEDGARYLLELRRSAWV